MDSPIKKNMSITNLEMSFFPLSGDLLVHQ